MKCTWFIVCLKNKPLWFPICTEHQLFLFLLQKKTQIQPGQDPGRPQSTIRNARARSAESPRARVHFTPQVFAQEALYCSTLSLIKLACVAGVQELLGGE